MEEQKSSDFMVDLVNSEAGMGASEILIVVLVAAAVAIGITWWLKNK